MSWKEIKPDASGVLTLFVAGAGMVLLTLLSLPSDHFYLGRGLPTLSRAAHPVLYWVCEILFMLAGVFFIACGVGLLKALIRQQRNRERDLEQQAIDSFLRDHQGTKRKGADDKRRNN